MSEPIRPADQVPVAQGAWGPPRADEYAPFYAGYVARVPSGVILELLRDEFERSHAVLAGLDHERAGHRYAPGKWSVREVVGHLADAERVFTYRALRFAREDDTPLPGFDENRYVEAGGADRRAMPDLLDEWASVRAATRTLAASMDAGTLVRRGVASNAPFSVRALFHIIVGHELHHRAILAERYGIEG
jgi:hypothetical protein